jgi:hypothetical protein
MADTKLSALTELAAAPASDDELYIRDVSEAAAAESKRITIANLNLSDVHAHSIADNAVVTVDQADVANNDIAKFTANGLSGRSYTELKSDIGLDAAAVAAVNAAGILLADTKVIEHDATPASSHTANGEVVTLTAHENVAFGQACYINTSGEAALAKADDAAVTIPAVVMAIASINADAAGLFLKSGYAHDDSWAFDVGLSVYLSKDTAGALTKTMPTKVTGNQVQVLGTCLVADTIYWNPSTLVIEYA